MEIQLQVADWLEELAVLGNPRHMIAAETAHHLCMALRHAYLVRMGLQVLDSSLTPRRGCNTQPQVFQPAR
jgi:hypothetical protein